MADIPFFLDKDESLQRESFSVFYGETTVLSSYGAGLGSDIGLVGGLATLTARKEEKIQGICQLYLKNQRLVL